MEQTLLLLLPHPDPHIACRRSTLHHILPCFHTREPHCHQLLYITRLDSRRCAVLVKLADLRWDDRAAECPDVLLTGKIG
jgi:hypothetical protein